MAYRGSCDKRLMVVEIGGQKVGVFFRSPLPSEYVGYHRDKMKLNGGKVESRLTEANMKYGLKVISGVRKGDLEYRENGAWKKVDTTMMPEQEWKTLLEKEFFDLVDFVGARVFNPVESSTAGADDDEPAGEDIKKK